MNLHGICCLGQALDYQDYQVLNGLAHEPWPSCDVYVCIESSFLDYIYLAPFWCLH